MGVLQTIALIYLLFSVLATIVVCAACAAARRSEQIDFTSNTRAPRRATTKRFHPSRCLRSEAMHQATVMIEGGAEPEASQPTVARSARHSSG